jgi:hypothetical protein
MIQLYPLVSRHTETLLMDMKKTLDSRLPLSSTCGLPADSASATALLRVETAEQQLADLQTQNAALKTEFEKATTAPKAKLTAAEEATGVFSDICSRKYVFSNFPCPINFESWSRDHAKLCSRFVLEKARYGKIKSIPRNDI